MPVAKNMNSFANIFKALSDSLFAFIKEKVENASEGKNVLWNKNSEKRNNLCLEDQTKKS